MTKLYLHKKRPGDFTTTKDTIVLDIDKLNGKYVYKKIFLNMILKI